MVVISDDKFLDDLVEGEEVVHASALLVSHQLLNLAESRAGALTWQEPSGDPAVTLGSFVNWPSYLTMLSQVFHPEV